MDKRCAVRAGSDGSTTGTTAHDGHDGGVEQPREKSDVPAAKQLAMRHRMRRRDVGEELTRISEGVLDAAFEVHRTLGRGLLERAYQRALAHELESRGHVVEQELPVEVDYKGRSLGMALRLDLLVDRAVVVEVKAVSELHESHEAQVRSYLRWTGCRVGMIFNFHAPLLRQGFRRFVN